MSVTLVVILVTALVSLAAFSSPALIRDFGLQPWKIEKDGAWYQTITSGFLHADFTHLLFNMFTLFFFGPALESYLGQAGFLIVYLGSMLGGSLLAFFRHREDESYRAIGASGAVSGVLFGYILFQPFSKIYLFLLPIGIPAFVFAIGYVLVSIGGMRSRRGRIGHDAHLGGAVIGVVLTVLLRPEVWQHFLGQF